MPTESTGTGTSTPLTYNLNNINVDTVENCNLLCKLVMDYMSTDKCEIEVLNYGESDIKKQRSFRIVYPEGSFINYRDTNYELTYAYFFYPSRHSIDGERYDLEVNIYHGIFRDENNSEYKKGIVAHTHYHNDDDDPTTYQHKHFHYHLPGDVTEDDKPHDISGQEKHTTKNVVTCLLYNMGKHVGNDVNIFFNQFIHHPEFKKIKIKETPENFTIDVHDNWNIEKIYPKKRSYFMYDGNEEDDKNTYVVFDTIQTISKEIIDRIYERGIKGAYKQHPENPQKIVGFDLNSIGNYEVKPLGNVLYRKNIEVITDEQYKKTKRAQIKDLLSLSRMSTYKPSKKTSKEYYQDGEGIIKSFSGGTNTGYLTNEGKAKKVADSWKYYGRDKPIEVNIDANFDLDLLKQIVFKQEYLQQYGYLERIYKHYKKKNNSFDEDGEPEEGEEKSNFQKYLDERKDVVNEDLKKKNIFKITGDIVRERDGKREAMTGRVTLALSRYRDMMTPQDITRLEQFKKDKNNVEYQEDIEKLQEETITFTETLRGKSAFFFYEPAGDENEVNIIKLRFFFEELTPGWNQKHGIDKSIISQLNEEGIRETLGDMVNVFLHINATYTNLANELIFVKEGPELTRTLSNEECQHWLSNETHYEGDLWKFWEEPVKLARGEYDFTGLPMDVKKKIGEGLLEYDDNDKWSTHNKCRNPGNRAAAPWCYTKNPNKRWEYCAKPYYSDILGKIVLLAIFVFIGVIAFFAIKKLFFYEYPMRFVATITGGTLATKDTFTANPAAPAQPSSK
jgi:carbonic anhydrase